MTVDWRSDQTSSESFHTPRFCTMTNDTTPHDQSVVDAAMTAALTTVESIKDTVTGALEAVTGEPQEVAEVPAEPKVPTFEDLGLHPDILQALADMGYFKPRRSRPPCSSRSARART